MYTFILCVHICFTTFKIAIKANWNIYYNISNVSATLNLSQMKRISGSHYFLDLFKNPTNCYLLLQCTHLREWKLVFCSVLRRVYVRRIYSSIAKDLKSDWSIQVTWKQRGICQHSSTKADKYSSCYLFLSLLGQVVYFHKTDYYCIILSQFFKIGVLKNFPEFTGKHLCRSFSLISHQPGAFSIRESDIDALFWILRNCQEHHFYRPPLNSHTCFCIYWT